MNHGARIIRLSLGQSQFLRNATFLPEALRRTLDEVLPAGQGACDLLVTTALAEELRSSFTDRLADVGFDAAYELTDEGRSLEELIDRFYVG